MINTLIKNSKITILFQPIISIKDQKIIAYEALTRAYDEDGGIIMPLFLFAQAQKENLSSRLDNYVRELAITKFKSYYKEDKSLLLFLNFESSIIENDNSNDFIDFVQKSQINPSNIVVEIKEDSVKETSSLQKFVQKYRGLGFIIAVDDFGTGYSSFDRLALIRPDIVKADRSLIYDVHNNFIHSEILSAISNMCHKIGAIVLAEGVESRDEILSCMTKDIDIFQGFWLCKPKDEITAPIKEDIVKNILDVGAKYRYAMKEHLTKKESFIKNLQELSQKVISILERSHPENEQMLSSVVLEHAKLEAVYILNEENGIQVGQTIIHSEEKVLYKPTKEGHDHSLKWYYLLAKDSLSGDYLSSKYISKATGNMCRTYSVKVSIDSITHIVCLDVTE